jgi:hypothetical protein
MSVLSIHPLEYLKFHLHLDRVQNRIPLRSSVRSLGRQIFFLADKAAAIALIILTISLVAFALMQIGESGTLMASYCNSCGLYSVPFVAPW